MKQSIDAETPVVDNQQKSGNGLKIATAVACVVAVCGIGFGIYGMMQSAQKDNQISDLKVQVKDPDGEVTTLETEKIETSDENGTTITIADSMATSYESFANNLIKSNSGKVITIYGANSSERLEQAQIDGNNDNHLTISVNGATVAEDDEVLSVYRMNGVGNGGNTYFYYIKKDGSVFRVQVSPEGVGYGEIEEVDDGHKKIVSVMDGSGFCPRLIDIDGNLHTDCAK